MSRRIRVLIVDDSALVRQMLTEMLSADPEVEVIGSASDPLFARTMIKELNPDVLTLDVEMPRMDGLNFLEKIMTLRPMPVVMVSSLTQKGAEAALRAMELGAVDIVAKPTIGLRDSFPLLQAELLAKIKAAAGARVRSRERAAEVARPASFSGHYKTTECIICIGASTGGVEALADVLRLMPGDAPAIAITQHMPASFTAKFASRLDSICAVRIAEARGGERMLPGHAYLAPGNQHLTVERSGANYVCRVGGTDPVSGHCPSVDVLFHSAARNVGVNAVGAILTGMGRDGAEGLKAIRQAGGATIGQNEATCVVYGMPRVAFELGAVERQVPLGGVAQAILEACAAKGSRAVRI
ncbi:protein-glutamate methylesterase/protein-glutamine glutaminase [Roseibium aestuarii]|uniref:Protein-glutamate methylesterase/protein-glutamine glutaminase n=1 Tax=Roseibium aestuarii TaxID=2600299 RepID=A0ABW4JZ52_9HYPH|nr:chemotaxis response regulator protein-glutamate methylesterase [Roseibium aestuarii]